jgi:hypothetical protein
LKADFPKLTGTIIFNILPFALNYDVPHEDADVDDGDGDACGACDACAEKPAQTMKPRLIKQLPKEEIVFSL